MKLTDFHRRTFVRAGWPKDQPKKAPLKAKVATATNADAVIAL